MTVAHRQVTLKQLEKASSASSARDQTERQRYASSDLQPSQILRERRRNQTTISVQIKSNA
jgi:hypothetical protein